MSRWVWLKNNFVLVLLLPQRVPEMPQMAAADDCVFRIQRDYNVSALLQLLEDGLAIRFLDVRARCDERASPLSQLAL
jgi:hypothetical protein